MNTAKKDVKIVIIKKLEKGQVKSAKINMIRGIWKISGLLIAAFLLAGCGLEVVVSSKGSEPAGTETGAAELQILDKLEQGATESETAMESGIAAGSETATESEAVAGSESLAENEAVTGSETIVESEAATESELPEAYTEETVAETEVTQETVTEPPTAIVVEPTLRERAEWLDISVLPTADKDVVIAGVDIEKAEAIDGILDSFGKDISLAVYSIDGAKEIFYNTEQKYFSACTIKISRMMYLCKAIDAGLYDKDTVMTYEERHYHQGSGKIRKGNLGDTYTLENLIHLCLSISDNVAYKMLIEVMDAEAYGKYTNELGYATFQIKGSNMWSSRAKVKDYIGIWNEVYRYLEEETVGSAILRKACTNTPFAYGVLTMKNYDYSHKSGDNFGESCAYHDAGIVWAETPYLYVVFSKCEGSDEDTAKIDAAMAIVHELLGK